jgi:hypothetical protein
VLQELCKDDGSGWFLGSLGDQNITVVPGTSLSAHINYANKGQLKVYYYQSKDGPISITWTTLGDDSWTQKTI